MPIPAIVATEHESNPDGPLLVLGPSLGSDCAILWELVLPHLADRFRLLSWDLPGHGASPAAQEAFSIADLADAVDGLVADLGVASAYYAGISIGGGTGLELAARHPDRFGRVALVCSNYRFGGDEWPDNWIQRAQTARTQSTSALIVSSGQRWFTTESIETHQDTVGRLLHALQDADDESYARCCEALAGFDFEPQLGEVPVPILDVYGEQDVTVARADAERLVAAVPRGELVVIEGAAHLATVDQPAAVAAALRGFFA